MLRWKFGYIRSLRYIEKLKNSTPIVEINTKNLKMLLTFDTSCYAGHSGRTGINLRCILLIFWLRWNYKRNKGINTQKKDAVCGVLFCWMIIQRQHYWKLSYSIIRMCCCFLCLICISTTTENIFMSNAIAKKANIIKFSFLLMVFLLTM